MSVIVNSIVIRARDLGTLVHEVNWLSMQYRTVCLLDEADGLTRDVEVIGRTGKPYLVPLESLESIEAPEDAGLLASFKECGPNDHWAS